METQYPVRSIGAAALGAGGGAPRFWAEADIGCHNIAGFESYAPIAPELSGWAKKDTSKLDYGYAIDDHHLQTHETFLTWKLDSPRIYRRDRIELRMADFDLSPREMKALTVFVMGLAEAKPLPEFNPTSDAGTGLAFATVASRFRNTDASFHPRLKPSCIDTFMPWPAFGLWVWQASPAMNTRGKRVATSSSGTSSKSVYTTFTYRLASSSSVNRCAASNPAHVSLSISTNSERSTNP